MEELSFKGKNIIVSLLRNEADSLFQMRVVLVIFLPTQMIRFKVLIGYRVIFHSLSLFPMLRCQKHQITVFSSKKQCLGSALTSHTF